MNRETERQREQVGDKPSKQGQTQSIEAHRGNGSQIQQEVSNEGTRGNVWENEGSDESKGMRARA
eukprot:7948699-Lingulodinium_polyedra.AAC.1